MLLWVSLLVLAPVSGQFATEPKSVIFLHSPWTTVFQGENVTLTCKAFHLDASEKIKWYRWYLLEKTQSETSGNTHEVHESGDYRCQAQDSPLSNRVGLLFSPANLILQSPLDVFEKESVILRCRAKANTVLKTIKLYKNGKVLEDHTVEIPVGMLTDFHIHQASLKDNGKYHCTGVKEDNELVSSNSVKIEVQELFPRPVLRASSTQPTEGGAVTLTCETQLSPQRPDVQLQFHFFRDRRSLGSGWRSSPEFWIHTIWRENSGSYWCQAQSMNPSVQKQSQRLQIQVKKVVPDIRIYPRPKLVFEGQELVLICSVNGVPGPITVSWYRKFKLKTDKKLHPSSKTEFKIPVVQNSHDGEYYCVASNSRSSFRSDPVTINSQPVLTLSPPGTWTFVGDEVSFDCEAQRGSLPIWYHFFHEGVLLMKIEATLWRTMSYRFSLTEEHSGNYYCTADNGLGLQSSETLRLSVTIPVSQPVLTLRAPRAQAVVGDMVELHCEAQGGSPPILYQFYHKDVAVGNSSAPLGGGASFNLSLTTKHSGNYSCKADNGLGVQQSEMMLLSVIVPVSRPILTLRAPRAQAVVGDVVELHCEAQRGSPPILYQFYHKNVTLESSMSHSGQGVSLNLSLTANHSGTYSCEADNGLGPQCSEAVTLSITGLTGSRSGPVATSVTGGLLSMMGLAAIALLFYCWLPRKAGRKPTFDSSRNPSASDPQEPTYHNVPSWIELQPVYSNVNPNRGDVVYSDVRTVKVENKQAAASDPELLKNTDSCVIYSQVKGAYTAAPKPQLLAASTPHR
ncbi:Fc receptor-like protein 5 [Neophocaena asiaeorientalis asiaeorientalis]|uniref:Fc receptor-like protein 5 n=1 Tax=Neophocaena asiaeorientalis asiaeorientalis TaxID=1706337 RepID=A0A341BUT1_NEOAA|nr:Fc receptor-like protein 5 [Neophocaena asiaeorientalis asiaeorientalis]